MFVVIDVKPGDGDNFTHVSITAGRRAVRDELGCFRFDVLRDKKDPNRFYLYEVYQDRDAAEVHWQTENFKVWKAAVDDMRDGEKHEPIEMQTVFPSDDGFERQKPDLLK